MKRNTVFFVLCLLSSMQSLQARPKLLPELSIAQGQQRAAHAQKLLLVHFSASWCMPSQWMEENSFSNPEVQQYLQQHYLAMNVDVDLPQGYMDKERYQVTTLPTLLVFSASGKLLDRKEGIATPAEFLEYLQENNSPENKWVRPSATHNRQIASHSGPPDFSHLDKPTFTSVRNQQLAADSARISTPALPMPVAAPPANSPVVQVNQAEYGVEIAVLPDYGSVIRFVRNLERRFDQKVYIVLQQTAQQKSYHVIMGAYPSRREAYQLRSHLLAFQIRGSVTALAFAKSE